MREADALREAVTQAGHPRAARGRRPLRAPADDARLGQRCRRCTAWSSIGVCLILGLFTPLAALAGAVFLGQIYLSMPPWPGLPPNPMAEGHYFIVNKNLIEMLACLVLACIPTGPWIGLDALLFGCPPSPP